MSLGGLDGKARSDSRVIRKVQVLIKYDLIQSWKRNSVLFSDAKEAYVYTRESDAKTLKTLGNKPKNILIYLKICEARIEKCFQIFLALKMKNVWSY